MSIYTDTSLIAECYYRAGLSIIPIITNGTKKPITKWAQDKWRRPLWSEIEPYWNCDNPFGIAILCGDRSNGVEVLDFDDTTSYPLWAENINKELLFTLPIIETPSGGRHIYWRISPTPKSQVLARDTQRKVLVETRGEGAYIIAPGSPLSTHKLNLPYVLLSGNPLAIPVITTAQREYFLSVAKSFNRYEKPERKTTLYRETKNTTWKLSVGSRFCREAQWEDILCPLGWRVARIKGDIMYWTKPGGRKGDCHATTGYGEVDCLHCFSTDCMPLEAERSYNKYAVYTMLYHNGDFSKARKEIEQKQLLR